MDNSIKYIDVWYDKYTNSWVIQNKNINEDQIGDADYVHSKKEALNYAGTYKKENEQSTIRIYKRDGLLQKVLD